MAIKSSWINLTDTCNNHCQWCYVKYAMTNHVMQYEKALQILDWMKLINCSSCNLIGGEPTLHPRFIDIFNKGQELGIKMHIITNGRRFSDENFCDKLISSGLSTGSITFSMHASSSQNSKYLVGNIEYFDEFEKGLDNLITRKIIPGINITISKPLSPFIKDMIEWSKGKGLTQLVFATGLPAISQATRDASFILSPDVFAQEVITTFLLAKKKNVNVRFLFKYPFCVLPKDDLNMLVSENVIYGGCHLQSQSTILFDVEGGIVPCNHLQNFPVYSPNETETIGNTGQLKNIWDINPKMKDIRSSSYVFRSEFCRQCRLWNICAGGCPIIWSIYSPSNLIKGID